MYDNLKRKMVSGEVEIEALLRRTEAAFLVSVLAAGDVELVMREFRLSSIRENGHTHPSWR
jgi:hypothetical protein